MAKTVSKKTKYSAKKPDSGLTYSKLRKYNFVVAALLAVQGLIILLISDPSKGVQSITTNYLANDQLASEAAGRSIFSTASHHLLDLNLAYVVAAFFFISALAHLIVATWKRKQYEDDLKKGINRARWVEYAFSASIMMVAVAVLSGVFDFASLIMIFSLTAIMSCLGLAMELRNQDQKKLDWFNYWLGLFAGLVPWLILLIYVWNAHVYGSGVSVYVLWIYASLLVLFSSFAVNFYLQYKKLGNWSTYLYGERVYIFLSFIAKTALAWQVYAGTLK